MNQGQRRFLIAAAVRTSEVARRPLVNSSGALKFPLGAGLGAVVESALWRLGEWRMAAAFEEARRRVPAYRRFLRDAGGPANAALEFDRWTPRFETIPVTDKVNYVRRFSVEQRCRNGRLPRRGVTIDESSGTSGIPNNWVRGPHERADVALMVQATTRLVLGDGPIFIINAFALGPWATGMTVSMSVVDIAVVKSVGPDIAKIVNTLNLFGPGYRYVICGYPPFLKRLVDSDEVDWSKFSCIAVCGGEGLTEGMRTYLLRSFQRVYSSYGASDLEINLAGENDFTIALRRLLIARPELGERLGLPQHGSAPMVFQYNPMDYHIESNESGEMIVSVCRRDSTSPKLRYNIHDIGYVVRFADLERHLRDLDVRIGDMADSFMRLPVLFHYGRSDATVAFYGCKIAPADIEDIMFNLPELAGAVDSFRLLITEDQDANKLLEIAFEIVANGNPPAQVDTLRTRVLDRLIAINQDYREASKMIPQGLEPTISFHPAATGPFANYDPRLKHQYIPS